MRGETLRNPREKVEKEVHNANITIIEGHDASQYGIGTLDHARANKPRLAFLRRFTRPTAR